MNCYKFILARQKFKNTTTQLYNVSLIIHYFGELNTRVNQILETISNNLHYESSLGNYAKIITNIQSTISEEINEIIPNKRTKRGLNNALGSIIKTISGNLDKEDGRKYEEMIKNLEAN